MRVRSKAASAKAVATRKRNAELRSGAGSVWEATVYLKRVVKEISLKPAAELSLGEIYTLCAFKALTEKKQ